MYESREEFLFVPAADCAPKQLAQYPTLFTFIPERCGKNWTIVGPVWSLTSNNELLTQTSTLLREFKTIYDIEKSKHFKKSRKIYRIFRSYWVILESIPRHELLQKVRTSNYPQIKLDSFDLMENDYTCDEIKYPFAAEWSLVNLLKIIRDLEDDKSGKPCESFLTSFYLINFLNHTAL